MERENVKGKIALTVIGVATLLTALVGATFAYFSATSTTTAQTVTTANLNLSITADGAATHVTNIKPTTWSDTMSDNTTNADIARIPFKVTGTSSTNGKYTVNMQTSIALNNGTVVEQEGGEAVALNGGEISDIKYRLYKKDGTAVGNEQSFAATTDVDIVTNAAITANVALTDEYILYVYINNTGKAQNKLQGIDFTITLGGSAIQTK